MRLKVCDPQTLTKNRSDYVRDNTAWTRGGHNCLSIFILFFTHFNIFTGNHPKKLHRKLTVGFLCFIISVPLPSCLPPHRCLSFELVSVPLYSVWSPFPCHFIVPHIISLVCPHTRLLELFLVCPKPVCIPRQIFFLSSIVSFSSPSS